MAELNAKKHVAIYLASVVFLVVPPVGLTGFLMALDAATGMKPSQGVAVMTMGVYILSALQFVVVQCAYYCWTLAKMWGPLQDGVTTVSVGKAIGLSFIPIFRVYWWFISWGSYPKAYNEFVARRRLGVAPLKDGVFAVFPIAILAADFFVFPLLFLPFVMARVIADVCKANNALAAAVARGTGA